MFVGTAGSALPGRNVMGRDMTVISSTKTSKRSFQHYLGTKPAVGGHGLQFDLSAVKKERRGSFPPSYPLHGPCVLMDIDWLTT